MKLNVMKLEMDITPACNLRCAGCSHYSNYGFKEHVPLEDAREWFRVWSPRFEPSEFAMLGGEPALHPQLPEFIRLAAEVWPAARRTLISNGFLLSRCAGLMEAMADTATDLIVSLHSQNPKYIEKVREQLVFLGSSPHSPKVQLLVRDSHRFYNTYEGEGNDMRPFAKNDRRRSWSVCHNKGCHTLYRGHLWKCPPIAFLGLVAKKFDLYAIPAWKPYLEYTGVGPTVSDEVLRAFFASEDEPICGMCPTTLQSHEALPDWGTVHQ